MAVLPEYARGRKMGGGFKSSPLNVKFQTMICVWSAIMARLDNECNGDTNNENDNGTKGLSSEMIELGKFMAEYFRNIPKERYRFIIDEK